MTRRNIPAINPNGTKFTGVVCEVPVFRTPTDQWRRVMAVVWRYQSAGFEINYVERVRNGERLADITIKP